MVFLSVLRYATKIKKTPRKYSQAGFKDSLRIYVQGGIGGNGLPKFGGVGGHGGSVVLVAKESITFDSFKKKRFIAPSGRNSTHNFILGPPGEDVKVEVPTGVSVITDLGKKLGELNEENEELVAAKGGTGGHQKNGYLGTKGQAYSVKLDLKLIADIGLVGFPNAGKSTLLKAVSHANPKIASYPFTTIRPNVGQMMYKDLRQISVADLPGLIEGAHINKGMGHKFLKHVERTKLLLLVVDINGFQLSPQYPHRSCLDTIILLNKELELYDAQLLNKPAALIINKMDTPGATEKYKEIKHAVKNLSDALSDYPEETKPNVALKFDDIMTISAKESSDDVLLVKNRLRHILDVRAELEQKQSEEKDFNVYDDIKEKIKERGPAVV